LFLGPSNAGIEQVLIFISECWSEWGHKVTSVMYVSEEGNVSR
jgi:hypothetical protein